MKTLLVYAHPVKNSFNHALKELAVKYLSDLKISDLYEMNFKASADWHDFQKGGLPSQYTAAQKEAYLRKIFTSDIVEEQEKLLWCDRLLLQFPFWWFSCPAIMKGWMDRVFSKGFAYDKGAWFEEGHMRGKKANLIVTTQSADVNYSEGEIHGPIELYLKPIVHTLRLVGFNVEESFIAYGVDGGSDELRQGYLASFPEWLTA